MWQTPKTDWKSSDYFNLNPDYLRIKGNIEALKELGGELYPTFSLKAMGDYTIEDIPDVDFFNTVEENVELLGQKTYWPVGYQQRQVYKENGRAWSHEDLNRLERNLQLLYTALKSQKEGCRALCFELGGGQLG